MQIALLTPDEVKEICKAALREVLAEQKQPAQVDSSQDLLTASEIIEEMGIKISHNHLLKKIKKSGVHTERAGREIAIYRKDVRNVIRTSVSNIVK